MPIVLFLNQSTPRPPYPAPHIRPKQRCPLIATLLLLIKPGRTFDESFERWLRSGHACSAEMIAKEIEAFLDTSYKGLIRVLH